MTPLTINYSSADYYIKKFKSIEDVIEFENFHSEIVKKENNRIRNIEARKEEEKQQIYNKLG
jgi:CBS domain containing-hemolysin-like protein